MKKIDVEAHFYTRKFQEYLRSRSEIPREEAYRGSIRLWYAPGVWEPHGPSIEERLLDLAEVRINAMDEAGIDTQVLSLSTPGCEQFSPTEGTAMSRKVNDELSEVIKKYPERYVGLATLAPQSPNEAAAELERAVLELGFRGAKVHSHVGDTYLDNPEYQVIFDKAAKLGVPIYLHPMTPGPSMVAPYAGYGFALAGPSLGFAAETAMQAMRLIYRGIFDQYPDLKIILGHLGEGLLFGLSRIDFAYKKQWMDEEIRPKISKPPSEYIRNNFMISTSGMFTLPAFMCALAEVGAESIMFSVDYPYEKTEEATQFIEKAPISETDREKICHLNAEKLFKLS